MQTLDSRIYAAKDLFPKIKKKYPETGRMTDTAIVHWALNKLLEA